MSECPTRVEITLQEGNTYYKEEVELEKGYIGRG